MSYGKDKDRLDAQRAAAQNESARREDNAALSGMTIGILLALTVAVLAGTFLYLSRRDESAPVVTPAISPTAAPSSAPAEKQTIIREEKTRELVPVPVPVPQTTAPQPNINITIPSAPSSSVAPSSSSGTEGSSKAGNPASASPESSPSLSPSPTP